MATMGESLLNEDPGIRAKDTNPKEDRSRDIGDAVTEPGMLDEEEMPSYVSLNSLPIADENATGSNGGRSPNPAREEERASSPYQSEQGAESICVLSSGEESDQRPYEMMDDYESDEMDMEEEEEEDDEEGEEDEDEDESCINEEEEGSDGDIEPEQFERSSDDFVLRYDGGLEKHQKERSRSLQDLTNCRGNLSRFVGKRRSIDLMGSYEPDFSRQTIQSLEDPLLIRKKISRPLKYDHVPSKVKLYIQEMKKQRRRSTEISSRPNPSQKNTIDGNSSYAGNDQVSHDKLNPANKTMKGYVQNVINELEGQQSRSEILEKQNYDPRSVNERVELTSINKIEEIKEIDEIQEKSSTEAIPEKLTVSSEHSTKRIKSNGLVDHANDKMVEFGGTNGQEKIAAIFNLRSLSYEEYTNGEEASKKFVENLSRSNFSSDNDRNKCTERTMESIVQTHISKRPSTSGRKDDEKIAREKDIQIRDGWNLQELTFEETARRKTSQVDLEVYEKTLDENIRLKRELEEMKKILEKLRSDDQPRSDVYKETIAENVSLKRELKEMEKKLERYDEKVSKPEMKVASVQTETENLEKVCPSMDESKQTLLTNKMLSSSITSALSSIGGWTDSNCSPAISIDPPNLENALNSDDSLALGEKATLKTPRPLSHSFVTSSRILQTLANITQGRSANPGKNPCQPEVDEQGQSRRQKFHSPLSGNEELNLPRAKKRKASEMLRLSGNMDSFKIPHTLVGDTTIKKMSTDSAADGAPRTMMEQQQQQRQQGSKMNERVEKKMEVNTARRMVDPEEDDESTDEPKNVKYFVYNEEPDSKERSFLIQANDSPKNVETLDRGGNVRECGPFLLGNVEIRMSETNGTINIWGKEINQSTEEPEVDRNIEDSEARDASSFVPNHPFVCQSTPHPKCSNVNNISDCSSSKKLRNSPKFSRSGIGKYFRSAATNLTRTSGFGNVNYSGTSPIIDNNRTNNCEHCNSHRKRINLPNCENFINSRNKRHSCCLHNSEVLIERDCDCISDNEGFDDSTMYETMANIFTNHEKPTNSFNNAATPKNFHVNVPNDDACTNHSPSCRRTSGSQQDFCHHTKKRCLSCTNDSPSCSARLASGNSRENTTRSRNNISCEDEGHPLLSNEEQCETPEIKRRRLSGKKVRGILTDLLRGCGGCRQPNSTSSLPRSNLQNFIPKIHITPASPSQASCSKRRNSCSCETNHRSNRVIDEKCCNSCSRRTEMRAEIENQLEIFRVAMEQLRSRSDAVLEMLHLLNAETD